MSDRPEPSSCLVFVGSYSPSNRAGIRAVRVHLDRGELVEVDRWTGVEHPSFLAVSPDASRLYAVSETGAADGRSGRVVAFAVDWRDGVPGLAPVGTEDSEGDHPCHLGLDPAGRWIAVSNYGSGSVAVLPLDPDGGLLPAAEVVRHVGSGPNPDRQQAPHAHSATPRSDGRQLIVADLGTDRLALYAVGRDADGPSLSHRADAPVAPGAGPRHTAVHPDGRHVLVANELDCTVTSYLLDDDVFSVRSTVSTIGDDAPDTIVAEIRLTDDGRRAFVSNRGDDSIAVLDVDDGELAPVARFDCGGSWPRNFAILPGGRHLLVANERSDRLSLLTLTDDGTDLAHDPVHLAVPSPTHVCVVPAR